MACPRRAVLLLAMAMMEWPLLSAGEHRHPPQDAALHDAFYSNWMQPDDPTKSCCNQQDCYPTVIQFRGDQIYARRREDGRFIHVPPKKVEQKRDSPDGRNHLCAKPPSTAVDSSADQGVRCFVLGSGQ